jgi:uncharacterized BrkB/YihY/UPF0761 family membrane protein
MSELGSPIAMLGRWLRSKRNFYVFSILGFGIPFWIGISWMFGRLVSSPLWLVYLAMVSFLASLIWAVLMRHFFNWYFASMPNRGPDDAA